LVHYPFSQGDYLSPKLFVDLGDIFCHWEKISTPNYILLSPNIQSHLGFIYTFHLLPRGRLKETLIHSAAHLDASCMSSLCRQILDIAPL